MTIQVLVTRDLPGSALQDLEQHFRLRVWREAAPLTPTQLQQQLQDCDGLLCMLTDRIDRTLLDSAPQLRAVSSCSVGVDHVDVAALSERGIPLGHTPGVLVDATADLAFSLLLSAARRLPEAERFVRDGHWTVQRRWEPELLLGRDLHGSTLGILGLGAIGQAVARRAQGFGLRVIGWTPSGRQVHGVESVSFADLLAQSDFLSLHLALSRSSEGIINAEALAGMRPDAILINTARGGLVDESALIDSLQSGRLGGAALDVFEQEPIAADHPLLGLPNVIVAPHIGSATWGTRKSMARLAVDNLIAGLEGRPMPHCANPEVYSKRADSPS